MLGNVVQLLKGRVNEYQRGKYHQNADLQNYNKTNFQKESERQCLTLFLVRNVLCVFSLHHPRRAAHTPTVFAGKTDIYVQMGTQAAHTATHSGYYRRPRLRRWETSSPTTENFLSEEEKDVESVFSESEYRTRRVCKVRNLLILREPSAFKLICCFS